MLRTIAQGEKRKLDPSAYRALLSHHWPDNLRELRAVLQKAALKARGSVITARDLPPLGKSPGVAGKNKASFSSEREWILDGLKRNRFRRAATAQFLGLARKTLYNKMQQWAVAPIGRGETERRVIGRCPITRFYPSHIAALCYAHRLTGVSMRHSLKRFLWLACATVFWNIGIAAGADNSAKTIVLVGGIKGVGLMTLHQASTLLPDDKLIDLPRWLGGARYGMVDRTTEMVEFKPAAHPISRGVGVFAHLDEFYPTIRLATGRISQSIGDRTVEMHAGDTVSIPMGVKHKAKNIGTEDAVLAISFSSADRQVVGE